MADEMLKENGAFEAREAVSEEQGPQPAWLAGFDGEVETLLGETMLTVSRESLIATLSRLRDEPSLRFTQLMDITAVDHPSSPERFCVVYNLLSVHQNLRVRVKVWTDEETPVASAVGLWPTAGWFEREVWDLYGVFFAGNPDLRRILTDYGFDGHPLRKDFPLTGHVEMRYDPSQARVIYEPVRLPQAFRKFDFLSPWDKPEYVLPGDEKAGAAATATPEKRAGA